MPPSGYFKEVGIVLLVIVGFGLLWKTFKPKTIAEKALPKADLADVKIHVTSILPETKLRAEKLIATDPESSKLAKAGMKWFRQHMRSADFRYFFELTLQYFGDHPMAYPAARFVATTMTMESNPEKAFIMGWSRTELKKNSKSLHEFLLPRMNDLAFENPYFQNRVLNMVHILSVTPKEKLQLYRPLMSRPISGDERSLSDHSLSFEIALLLSKQGKIGAIDLAPVIASAIQKNQRNPAQVKQIEERVTSAYPDLAYLFNKTSGVK